MHRTYRWLDAPPRLFGFTFRQWIVLIASVTAGYGLVKTLHVPAKIAVSTGVFLLGLPAALAYLSEGDGLQVGRLARDALGWVWARIARRGEDPAALLGLAAVGEDGVAIRSDGTLLRYLDVAAPVNPLVADEQSNEQVADALGGVLARLDRGQGLQFYVQARPLAVSELLAEEAQAVALAASSARHEGHDDLAGAMRRLGGTVEESLKAHCEAVAAMGLRYVIVVPWRPGRVRRTRHGGLRLQDADYERALRDSLRHTEGIRRDLEAMRLPVRELDGREVLDLLWSRFDPDSATTGAPAASFMRPDALGLPLSGEPSERTLARTRALGEAACTVPLDFTARGHVQVGDGIEQVSFLSGVPEHTWLGWLLALHADPPRVLTLGARERDGQVARAPSTATPVEAVAWREPRHRTPRATSRSPRGRAGARGARADTRPCAQHRRRRLPRRRLPAGT